MDKFKVEQEIKMGINMTNENFDKQHEAMKADMDKFLEELKNSQAQSLMLYGGFKPQNKVESRLFVNKQAPNSERIVRH